MKSNRREWLKTVSVLTLALFLVATAGSSMAQRAAKRGRGNPNWGGSTELRETALQSGYDEGIKAGRNDRSHGERFNYTDESEYKVATTGYSASLGDKTTYQRYFRAGFENGYRDGWNGY